MFFSKSKYCGLWQCPKIAWLKKYKPEEYIIDEIKENKLYDELYKQVKVSKGGKVKVADLFKNNR